MVLGTKPPANGVRGWQPGRSGAAGGPAFTCRCWLPSFAPALSAWRNLPALQALFYSFFAALRNWRAFISYSFALMLLSLACSVALFVLALLLRGLLATSRRTHSCW